MKGLRESTEEESKVFLTRVGRFDDLLLEIIDEVLRHVLGEMSTKIIYNYLEKVSHLKPEEIAGKQEVFYAELDKLLGSGGQLIKRLILKSLYSKLDLKFMKKDGYTYSDYIEELRKNFTNKLSCSENSRYYGSTNMGSL